MCRFEGVSILVDGDASRWDGLDRPLRGSHGGTSHQHRKMASCPTRISRSSDPYGTPGAESQTLQGAARSGGRLMGGG